MIVNKKINNYIDKLTPQPGGGLSSVKDQALKEQIPIIDTQVESFLIYEIATRRISSILEIGTAVGYSGSAMLSAAEDAHLDTIELDPSRIEEAEKNFLKLGLEKRVTIHKGDAKEVLDTLDKKYDLVFIDGPKSHYQTYLDKTVPKLTDTGIIICDNVLFRGLVAEDPQDHPRYKTILSNMQNFLQNTMEREDLLTSLVPIGDGLLLVAKK